MKFLLIYYTGTFNTRFLTERLEEALRAHGHETNRVEIRRNTPPAETNGYDFIGFGYPIYGFNSPLPFNRYVQKLKFPPGQKFFIYKNSGETFAVNNASSRILLRRMKRRKAVFAGEYHFVMPYNIHFASERNFVREILQKNDKLLEILVHGLENGNAPRIKSNPVYNIASAAVSVQKAGGAFNSFFTASIRKSAPAAGFARRTAPKTISASRTARCGSGIGAICVCAVLFSPRQPPLKSDCWRVGR